MPNHDFVSDALLVITILLACALIVILVSFARYYQRQIVEFDSDAVDSFGRRYGLFALVVFGLSEALNYLLPSMGIKNRFVLQLPAWLMITCICYILYAGNMTLYRSLTNTFNHDKKK